PIYNLISIKVHPSKPVMFVEGEKTAEAAIKLFPEMNVVTWLSGSNSSSKADLTHFKGMKIYLVPDNDPAGYKAMNDLAQVLYRQNNELFMVDVASLGVPDKWDIADLDSAEGTIEFIDLKMCVYATKK